MNVNDQSDTCSEIESSSDQEDVIMNNGRGERSPLIRSTLHSDTDLSSKGSCNVSLSASTKLFKVYKRRWYVLGVFTAIATVCNMEWNAWGPIAVPCQISYGWENWQILFLSSWVAISLIVGAAPLTWLMDTKGLRCSVVLCAFFMTAGKAVQVIPTSNKMLRTILMNVGQCILMFGSPVALGAPPSISATWFPPSERNTATAIATLAAYFGIALSFAIGPAMAPVIGPTNYTSANGTHLSYFSEHDKKAMETGITNFLYLQLALSGFLFMCALVYFPNRPPLPPSLASVKQTIKYKDGLKRLLMNRSYWLIAVVFSLSFGVYFGWLAVFAIAVEPFGIEETEAGWLGCAGTMAGILSGIILARCADYIQHYTRHILIILFCGSATAQLLFSLTCSEIIPYSEVLLYASIIMGGMFFNGTSPLLFELAMECVYPVAEGATAVLLLVVANMVYLGFQISFMFPVLSVKWMNWFTVGATGICAPLLLLYKNNFSRLELDLNRKVSNGKQLGRV